MFAPKHIYLQCKTWYVPRTHTKGYVFTGYTSMYAVTATNKKNFGQKQLFDWTLAKFHHNPLIRQQCYQI